MNPLESRWTKDPVLTVDGGFMTEVERKGYCDNFTKPPRSGRLLHTNPQVVKDIYLSYLRAGADIIITASYSAHVDTFMKYLGLSEAESRSLIKLSVTLAQEAREEYMKENPSSVLPLIAGSVGPFGSHFFNGSSYSGKYVDTVTPEQLKDWHRPRVECLVEAGVDFISIETIPAKVEADALVDLLKEFPSQQAWIAFTCKNATETGYGDNFAEAAASVCQSPQVIAVGLNCLAPQHVEGLLLSAKGICTKPLIVYPNSGEEWKKEDDTSVLQWVGTRDANSLASYVPRWIEAGAKAIGGCCRTGPEDVTEIKAAIKEHLQTIKVN